LEKFNCFVEQGKELTRFEPHDDHVIAYIRGADSREEVVRCQWLVGSDGAHSTVRKQLALPFLGNTEWERQMLTGDVHLRGDLDRKVGKFALRPPKSDMTFQAAHFFGTPENVCVLYPCFSSCTDSSW
jgi:2-polyprenyl-6-methoxyphenol hydroxylase-like FAD-dependent oxidoreductase